MTSSKSKGSEEPTERSPLIASENGKPLPPYEEQQVSSQGAQKVDTSRRNNHDRHHNDDDDDDDNDNDNDNDDEPFPDEPSTHELILVMSGAWLGSFLAALDSTIIATLSAPISTSFHSLSLLSWLASAYFIANAALQPLAGRLTDILGRRTGLIFCNVCFGLGNVICASARAEWAIILGRVVAGMGGGGLNAISTFVASDLVPLRRRGVWQGFGNISYGLGATLGGVLGGWINDTWGWRWAFWIQVPFTVVSGALVLAFVRLPMKRSEKPAWRRIDLLGAVLLVATLVLLLLGVNSGGNVVPWTHPLVYVSLSLAAVGFIGFILVEDRWASEPVIPVRLLLNRTVLSACFTNWFATMAVFSLLFYGPIYFQVRGQSTTEAGLRLVPQSLGTAIGSVTTGLIMRLTGRYYVLSVSVEALFVGANAIFASFQLHTPTWETILAFCMAGLGYSGMLTTTLLALISAVEHKHQAVITSASYAFRSTGSAIGITIASAVFQNILKFRLQDVLGHRQGGPEAIAELRDSLEAIKALPVSWQGEVRDVYMEAIRAVFLTTLGLSALGAGVSLLMREHTLYGTLARK